MKVLRIGLFVHISLSIKKTIYKWRSSKTHCHLTGVVLMRWYNIWGSTYEVVSGGSAFYNFWSHILYCTTKGIGSVILKWKHKSRLIKFWGLHGKKGVKKLPIHFPQDVFPKIKTCDCVYNLKVDIMCTNREETHVCQTWQCDWKIMPRLLRLVSQAIL